MEKFTWKASEPQTYDKKYGTQTVTQDSFNKNTDTVFTMHAPDCTLTLNPTLASYWPEGDDGRCEIEISRGTLIYNFLPDNQNLLQIGTDKGPEMTSLDIESTFKISDNTGQQFCRAYFFFAETKVYGENGELLITGDHTDVAMLNSSLSLHDTSHVQSESQNFSGGASKIDLYDQSRMDMLAAYMSAEDGDFEVSLYDSAELAIKAEAIGADNVNRLVFNLAGESAKLAFMPAKDAPPFDFTRPRKPENFNLITFNFTGADGETNNSEITFEGYPGRDLNKQKDALLANGFLSYNGEVITDKDQKIFTLYASQFTGRIEVSLRE
ncbi:hypothetical protein QCD58_005013 [Enterobacter hormaechei]|nr:hypothetical protein [Enterobacter hormaechei]